MDLASLTDRHRAPGVFAAMPVGIAIAAPPQATAAPHAPAENQMVSVGVVILQNLGGDTGSQGIDQLGYWLLDLASAEMRGNSTDCHAPSP